MGNHNRSPWKNRIVCYDHSKRQCFDETNGKSRPITFREAKEAWESGCLSDFNLALRQLAIHDWKPSAVEEYYRECDKYR